MAEYLDVSQSLIFLTNRVARQLSGLVLSDMDFEGWKPQGTHMAIMADLLQADGVRQQDLAVSTIKDKGTITRGLQGLEKEGLLVRRVNPVDRRNKLIFLTEKGRRLHTTLQPRLEEHLRSATRNIAPEALAQCTATLYRIYENLQENINAPISKSNE